jgi:hypothetical protein
VTYASRTAQQPVTAAIDGAPASGGALDGPAGARDTIAQDVETLKGGSGADALTGSGGPNTLVGGPGVDDLRGLRGADVLRADDGIADSRLDCDGDPEPDGASDQVVADQLDPDPMNCEGQTRV